MARYIFVCGGVMSGIGKGVATSSIGRILKSKGYKVTAIKIDPYINVDAGTMNPIEHGEVFVTDDGTECDQDIGNYERFLGENIYNDNYITTGRVYLKVIEDERALKYGGRCVETIPHITDEILRRITNVAKKSKADFVLIEIGGTVGEYQNLIFLEAARIFRLQKPGKVLCILVSYLPVPRIIGEMKTKPTQYAARSLNSAGLQPDIIIARSDYPLDEPRKRKISIFCNMEAEDIISAPDAKSIYDVPINFEKEHLSDRIFKKFHIKPKKKDLVDWRAFVEKSHNPKGTVKIAVAGKYFKSGEFTLLDSYISVLEAVKHASFNLELKPEIVWLDVEKYEHDPKALDEDLRDIDGVIVPGGFGNRGIEGKIVIIQYLREHNIPFLGLCLGMQLASIEFARNVVNLKDATSTEFDPKTKAPLIDVMIEQKVLIDKKHYGGTMRLGSYDCELTKGSVAFNAYKDLSYDKEALSNGNLLIKERHRHRYEFNNKYREALEEKGFVFSGKNPQRNLVEVIEIPTLRFFVASQFHPEFKSRPLRPQPLFVAFIRAAYKRSGR